MLEFLVAFAFILAPAPTYCSVQALTDYQFGFGRIVAIQLDPACPPGGIARVQAVSASRSRRLPDRGAWTLTTLDARRYEFLQPFWNVEYWNGARWVPARKR